MQAAARKRGNESSRHVDDPGLGALIFDAHYRSGGVTAVLPGVGDGFDVYRGLADGTSGRFRRAASGRTPVLAACVFSCFHPLDRVCALGVADRLWMRPNVDRSGRICEKTRSLMVSSRQCPRRHCWRSPICAQVPGPVSCSAAVSGKTSRGTGSPAAVRHVPVPLLAARTEHGSGARTVGSCPLPGSLRTAALEDGDRKAILGSGRRYPSGWVRSVPRPRDGAIDATRIP
jgi:hypothetical protein